MSPSAYPGPRPDRATAQLNREAAFARLTRVRGTAIVVAGALTAVVAGVASNASGRTLGSKHVGGTTAVTPRRARPAAGTAVKLPPLASAGQLGLGSPDQAPQPVPQPSPAAPPPQAAAPQPQSAPAPAVSGGS